MYDNYNYPPGSDTPDAPWNQSDLDPQDVDICVSTCLSKSTTVEVDDYTYSHEYDADIDDEGHAYCNEWDEIDYSSCNFNEAYTKQHMTIPELLKELVKLAEEKKAALQRECSLFKAGKKVDRQRKTQIGRLKYLIEEASGWVEDELDIELE